MRQQSIFAKNARTNRRRWYIFFFFITTILGISFYMYRTDHQVGSVFAKVFLPLSQWMQSHKQATVKKNTPTKVATAVSLAEPQIHFEFYQTLPQVEMKPAIIAEENKQSVKSIPMKTFPIIANAEELERDLKAYSAQVRSAGTAVDKSKMGKPMIVRKKYDL